MSFLNAYFFKNKELGKLPVLRYALSTRAVLSPRRKKLVLAGQKETEFALVSDLSKSLSTMDSLPVELKFHGVGAMLCCFFYTTETYTQTHTHTLSS